MTISLMRLVLSALLGLVLLGAGPGFVTEGRSQGAADIAPAVARFAADSYSDTEAGLAALALSPNPQAAAIVDAVGDGRLMFDPATKTVYVKTKAGGLTDAATGAAVTTAPADLKTVRLNNRVRRAVEAAAGALALASPDAAKRIDAAGAVFKSRDVAALPALDAAIARERDTDVKAALAQARAAIILTKVDAPEAERIAATKLIVDRGDQEALALLAGVPADASPA
ncbi:MAG: hypothetical protein B7Y61_18475, partial [Rhizobiales bacterium 35-66-30]